MKIRINPPASTLSPFATTSLLSIIRPSKSVLLPLGLLLLLTGCASIARPPADLSEGQLRLPAAYAAAGAEHRGAVQTDWLETFPDETLLRLVEEAMRANPDLAAAAAQRDAALAAIRIAESALLPQLEGVAGAEEADQGLGADDRINLGLQVGWEVDLWGRLRSNEEAAAQEAIAASLQYEYGRRSLAATVAQAWFLAITAREQLAIDLQHLQAEQLTLNITTKRVEVGVNVPMDQEISTAYVNLARDAVAQSRLALSESARALELLLGRYPAAELETPARLPEIDAPIPTGLPSELLERRPDLAAADRRVAAAFHRVESAQAARLPRVFLSASMGTLLNPANTLWSIGSNLLAPLYTGGELEAQVEIREAEQREALANYVSVALTAFREVESALANLHFLQERETHLTEAEIRLAEAVTIAQARYDAGLMTILDLTQVRRQYFDTASQLLRVRNEQLQQRINLYLALGGSYDRDADRAEVQETVYGN